MWPGIIQAAGQANSSGQALQLLPGQRLGTINAGLFGFMIEPFGRNVEGVWVGEDSSLRICFNRAIPVHLGAFSVKEYSYNHGDKKAGEIVERWCGAPSQKPSHSRFQENTNRCKALILLVETKRFELSTS